MKRTALLNLVFGRPNTISERVYLKKDIKDQLRNFVNSSAPFIELGQQHNSIEIVLNAIAAKVEKASMHRNGTISIEYTILKTPAGMILEQLLDNGVNVLFQAALTGVVSETKKVSNVTLHKIYVETA
jgi:hypothetical protein